MSVELYPDHKAILNFYDSLTVLEIDLLSYLTTLLSQEPFAQRQFNLYVKPTLHQTAFDFIVVEPNHTLYIIQAPENREQFEQKKEALKQNLHPSFQNEELIKPLFYIYNQELYDTLIENEENSSFITPTEFEENTNASQKIFTKKKAPADRLTVKESRQIEWLLNPNTNLKDYIPKTVPTRYEEYSKSKAQAKHKFKRTKDVDDKTLLVKRVLNCARRLNDTGKILVIAGDPTKALNLKDLMTAEDGRSLQELGIEVENYHELSPPNKKYKALFIADAENLKTKDFKDLLDHYLIEMSPENDYEYVVIADEENLPQVPQIYGRFITLEKDPRDIDKLLQDSREIFLEILQT